MCPSKNVLISSEVSDVKMNTLTFFAEIKVQIQMIFVQIIFLYVSAEMIQNGITKLFKTI
jgi:hypothetical protein